MYEDIVKSVIWVCIPSKDLSVTMIWVKFAFLETFARNMSHECESASEEHKLTERRILPTY